MTTNRFITINLAALLLLAVSACAPTATRSPADVKSTDSDITANIKAATKSESALDGSAMDVSTSKGVVHLSGFVTSHAQVVTATDIARSIAGVTAVENDVMVKTIR